MSEHQIGEGGTRRGVSGGQLLVSCLRSQGVDRIFCVPGESYLPVLDALADVPNIAVISARHEGAAANMAEADGKLTGRPGICFVTRGPGATHAAVGVHTAFQDSTPMILFIGQVSCDARDREGFQEVDFRAMFGPVAKWAAQIDSPGRIPEYVARAYSVALSGRPGPVVLALPEDVLSAVIDAPGSAPRVQPSGSAPRAGDIERLVALTTAAQRPLAILGGTGWTAEGCRALLEFARSHRVPVAASFRRQDLIDNRESVYCGHLGLGADPDLTSRLKAADLVLAIGTRLSENTTAGYSLLAPPVPSQTLVHVHPDASEVGRVYQPTLGIACGLADFAKALPSKPPVISSERLAWLEQARAGYVRFSTPGALDGPGTFVDPAAVVSWLNENLADDAIVANGAGNYTVWVHRYFRYRQPRTELAPISGAMGYGVPAAIAAKMRHPDRQVIAFAGDGCFLMYPQELGTAVQHRANVIVLVVNNGMYGTIRMHQERRFPGRVIGTDILSPDFVALARSFGAFAERVETTAAFPEAFRAAVKADRPALLELRMDPMRISPTMTLRSAAKAS